MASTNTTETDRDDEVSKSFNWLRREARGSTYISYSEFSNRAACSFDFGAAGFAASCNHGGELLHMSARSTKNGIIFTRGDFENSLYSTLARGQRIFGGKSTFGLKVAANQDPFYAKKKNKGSSFRLGPMIETGCFNYRWPVREYALALNGSISGDKSDESTLKETGTCVLVSFIKDGVLYQVLRLEQGCRGDVEACYPFPTDGQIVLQVGGPIQFQAFGSTDSETGQDMSHDGKLLEYSPDPGSKTAARLEVRVYQVSPKGDYQSLELQPSIDEIDGGDDSVKSKAYISYARMTGELRKDRSATFLAAFRLQNGHSDNPWPKIPTSQSIYTYMGIKSSSVHATGAMWDAIFRRREEETNFYSKLSEFKLIGRCLEKVLEVDLVQAAFSTAGKINYEYEEDGPLALVSNLFLLPSIDLKALFWKVRFLVEAHQYLSYFNENCFETVNEESKSDEASQGKKGIPARKGRKLNPQAPDITMIRSEITEAKATTEFQMTRIQSCIERIMEYLVRALIKPGTSTNLLPDEFISVEPNYYYVIITLWYVVGKCSGFTWKWLDEMGNWPARRGLLAEPTHLPADNDNFGTDTKERVALFKWYHYASVLELCENKVIPDIWRDVDHCKKVYLFKRGARRVIAAKLSSHGPYLPEDEVIDRLSFLAEELGLDDCKNPRGTIASATVRRIKERDFTRELNPGLLGDGDEGPTSGPWEIHALCHHSRLLVANYQYRDMDDRTWVEKAEEAEKFRRKFSDFLTAEGSVVPCWERTHLVARRGWLRSEATCILVSTLLGICQEDFALGMEPGVNTEGEDGDLPRHDTTTVSTRTHAPELESNYRVGAFGALQDEMPTALPPIEWIKYRPPRYYHPESFFNSLDDTPELYRSPFTERVSIPRPLRSRLAASCGAPRSEMIQSLESLDTLTIPSDINKESVKSALSDNLISVIDLKVGEPGQFGTGGRQYQMNLAGQVALLPENVRGPSIPGDNGERISRKPTDEDKKILERVLTDSLVDQEVQHRIMAVGDYSTSLLRLFIYVFHPESADGFSNHVLRFSGFSCHTRGTWVSRITLRSWSLSRINGATELERPNDLRSSNQSNEDFPIQLPDTLKPAPERTQSTGSKSKQEGQEAVKLKVSSLVLSTNVFGDFSQCTIISELISSKELKSLGQQSQELWERFIHQPQTGRCLVFLLTLGVLCRKIADDYEKAVKYFVDAIDLDNNFTQYDLGDYWLSGDQSLRHLQLGLWSLESLYKLSNSLIPSINSIEQAKAELMVQINEGPGKRSDTLERMCQEAVKDFERNLGLLTALNAKLDRKIQLNGRYKDSLSTVLSLRDSRNSYTQNSTIQKLTYLTIGYLPVGLSAAIFAIPNEQNVVFPNMGRDWFIGCIVIMFVITFIIAALLGSFLKVLGSIFEPFKQWDFSRSDDSIKAGRERRIAERRNSGSPSMGGSFGPFHILPRTSGTGLLTFLSETKIWRRGGADSFPSEQSLPR